MIVISNDVQMPRAAGPYLHELRRSLPFMALGKAILECYWMPQIKHPENWDSLFPSAHNSGLCVLKWCASLHVRSSDAARASGARKHLPTTPICCEININTLHTLTAKPSPRMSVIITCQFSFDSGLAIDTVANAKTYSSSCLFWPE